MAEPLHLDGTTLEGGGQLLRLAICLSSLTSTPIHITNVRGNRSGGGGLKAQHLTCVQWLAHATSARAQGLGLKGKEINFHPGAAGRPLRIEELGSDIVIKQTTPGSVDLVLQAVLPYILFSGTAHVPVRLRITGGTNVSNSPSIDYVSQVLFPMLQHIGIPSLTVTIHSRGWSTGSSSLGAVTFTITPPVLPLPGFHLSNRGPIISLHATIIAPASSERDIRDELSVTVEKRAGDIFATNAAPALTTTFEDSHHEKRFYLLLVATSATGMRLGRDWLYNMAISSSSSSKSKPSSKSCARNKSKFSGSTGASDPRHVPARLVKKVVDDLVAEVQHGGCVDEYMRDQIVAFQALAEGRSSVFGGRRSESSSGSSGGGEGRGGAAGGGHGKKVFEVVEPSLHARTAEWVAQKVTGAEFDGQGGCRGIAFTGGHRRM